MKRQLNVPFLIGLIVATALIGASFYGLHAVQVKRSAGKLLRLVDKARSEGDHRKAADYLERYLSYRPNDVNAMVQFGTLLAPETGTVGLADALAAVRAFDRALILDPQRDDVRRRCIDLQMKTAQYVSSLYDDARAHLTTLLNLDSLAVLNDGLEAKLRSQLDKATKESLLKWQLGQCLEARGKYKQAEICYEKARADDPTLVGAYARQAFLLQAHLNDAAKADEAMDVHPRKADGDGLVNETHNGVIAHNAESYRAYLERARYEQVYRSPIAAGFVAQSTEKAADQAVAEAARTARMSDAAKRMAKLTFLREAAKTEAAEKTKIEAAVLKLAVADAKRARELVSKQTTDRDAALAETLSLSALLAVAGPNPDPDAARGFLREGLKLAPTNALMYQLLARVDQIGQQPRPEDALKTLRDGLQKLPKNEPGRVELQWEIIDLLIQTNRMDEARKLLDELAPAGDPRLLAFGEARLQIAEGKWYKAEAILKKLGPELAVKADEKTRMVDRSSLAKRVFLMLGQCYERMNRPDQQYDAFRRAMEISIPGAAGQDVAKLDEQAMLGMAQALVVQEKFDSAIEQYQKLCAWPGAAPEAYLNLASVAILKNSRLPKEQQDWSIVNDALDQADKAAGSSNDALGGKVALARADARVVQNQIEAADQVIADALRRHPKLVELWIAKAAIQDRQGHPDEALKVLKTAAAELGQRVELLVAQIRHWGNQTGPQASKALPELERLQDQAKAFRETAASGAGTSQVEADKKKEDALRLVGALADAYVRIGAQAKARDLIRQAASAERQSPDLQLALFEQDLRGKDLDAAAQTLSWIRKLDDETDGGSDGLIWRYCQIRLLIEQADLNSKAGKPAPNAALFTQAEKLLQEIAQRRPSWLGYLRTQAQLDLLQNRRDLALDNFLKAIAAGNRDPVVIQQTSRLLLEQNRYREADELLKKIDTPGDLSGDVRRMAAQAAEGVGDYERALADARQAVTSDSKNDNDLVWFGQLLLAASLKDREQSREEQAKGRLIEAEQVLRRAVDLDRKRREPWLVLVRVLVASDQRPKAQEALQEAGKALGQDQQTSAQDKHALAQCHELLGQNDQAYDLYQQALKTVSKGDPKLVSTILQSLAIFCLRTNRADKATGKSEALTYLDTLNRLPAGDVPAPIQDWTKQTLAVLETFQGGGTLKSFQQAMAILGYSSQTRKSAPVSPQLQRTQAKLLALRPNMSQRREAIEIFESLISRDDGQPGDMLTLAKLYETDNQWAKTRALIAKLLAQAGDNPAVLSYYVGALLRHNEAEAAGYLDRLEKAAPNQVDTLSLRVRFLHKNGQTAKAVALLKVNAQNDRKLLEPVAGLFEELNQLADAEAAYRAVREKFPEFPTAILPLAGFLGRHARTPEALDLMDAEGWKLLLPEMASSACVIILYSAALEDRNLFNAQCDRAAAWIQKAIDAQPAKTALKFDLANIRSIQGRCEEAESIYREVASKEPNSGAAFNNLAWLLALEGGEGKLEEARQLVQQAMGIDGETPELLDTRAVIDLAKGQINEAIHDLEEAIAVKESSDKNFHLARAYLKANRLEEARERLKKARELGFNPNSLHPLERPSYEAIVAALGSK